MLASISNLTPIILVAALLWRHHQVIAFMLAYVSRYVTFFCFNEEYIVSRLCYLGSE